MAKGTTTTMSKRKEIIERYPEDVFVFADGFDEAIIGVEDDKMIIVYSTTKTISILYSQMELTEEQIKEGKVQLGFTEDELKMEMAKEHFYYNVKGSKGKNFPIFIDDEF